MIVLEINFVFNLCVKGQEPFTLQSISYYLYIKTIKHFTCFCSHFSLENWGKRAEMLCVTKHSILPSHQNVTEINGWKLHAFPQPLFKGRNCVSRHVLFSESLPTKFWCNKTNLNPTKNNPEANKGKIWLLLQINKKLFSFWLFSVVSPCPL